MSVLLPFLLTLQAINAATTMTDITTMMSTAAATPAMIAQGTSPKVMFPPVVGGGWDEVTTTIFLVKSDARLRGSCTDDDARWDDVGTTVLSEMDWTSNLYEAILVDLGESGAAAVIDETAADVPRESGSADVIDETAADVLRENGLADVIDETEVLVTSGTAYTLYENTINLRYCRLRTMQ